VVAEVDVVVVPARFRAAGASETAAAVVKGGRIDALTAAAAL
jgi:hypothetical protein